MRENMVALDIHVWLSNDVSFKSYQVQIRNLFAVKDL